MAQANNPLSGLEFQIRNLIGRGTEESLSAAESLIRAFSTSGGTSGDLTSAAKDLTKTRSENQAKAKIREVRARGRKSVNPREEIQRLARQQPLQRFEQAGPPAPTPQGGEPIAAGQPGGPALISNAAGQVDISQLPEGDIETDLLEFTEDDIADLQAAGMPVAGIKQLIEARDSAIAKRQVREVSGEDNGIPEEIAKLPPDARESALKRMGTLAANRNAPLGVNAFKWIDPKSDTFESADPGISEAQAIKRGLKTVTSNNPQFISAARSAQGVLDELDVIIDNLFTDKKGPAGSNFISIHSRRLRGDAVAQRFIGLIDSTRALFARAGGDVANIAVAEQEFQAAALPSAFSSHRQAKDLIKTKKRLLKNIVRAGLGLAPLPVPKVESQRAGDIERRDREQSDVDLFGGKVVDSR